MNRVREAFQQRGWLNDKEIARPRKPFNGRWDIKEARRLREQGMSWRKVAERVGCGETNVARAFKRRGWTDGSMSHVRWDIEEARRLRRQGLSWRKVAERVGCDERTVRYAFKRRGWTEDAEISARANSTNLPRSSEDVSTPTEGAEVSDSGKAFGGKWDLEEARRLRKQGVTWREVAARLGCSRTSVQNAFRRRGWLNDEEIARPRKPFRGKWDIEEARRLRGQGMSFREVAERVGSSEHTVWQTFRRRGWTENKASSSLDESSSGEE